MYLIGECHTVYSPVEVMAGSVFEGGGRRGRGGRKRRKGEGEEEAVVENTIFCFHTHLLKNNQFLKD